MTPFRVGKTRLWVSRESGLWDLPFVLAVMLTSPLSFQWGIGPAPHVFHCARLGGYTLQNGAMNLRRGMREIEESFATRD
jgi:hypothetical protein